MKTLYLGVDDWDLAIDSAGNIATAENPYSLAQDAASAIKTFSGEAYYNTTLGVPYFGQILGENPSLEFVRAQLRKASLTVPEVIAARVFFTDFSDRTLTGQVQVTDSTGVVAALNF